MKTPQPVIDLEQVSREFAGPSVVRALDTVSLSIDAGELVAILGASGSGKSTLLGIMGLLDRPSKGVVKFAGVDVSAAADDLRTRLRRTAIGFVFQNFHLLGHKPALGNVLMGLTAGHGSAADRVRSRDALASVSMSNRAEFFPWQLSGGERQRVSIARALVRRPQLILADEPTGNLDTANRDAVLELLNQARRPPHSAAVVLVTHDREVAATADRIIVMEDGRIQSLDKPADPAGWRPR